MIFYLISLVQEISVRLANIVGRRAIKHNGIKVKHAIKSIQGEWTTKFSKLYPAHGIDKPQREYIPEKFEGYPTVERKRERKLHYTDRFLRRTTQNFPDEI